MSVDECLHRLDRLERASAHLEVEKVRLLARIHDRPDPAPVGRHISREELEHLSAAAEVACALRISHETASRRLPDPPPF
jgi:hypothetical protein